MQEFLIAANQRRSLAAVAASFRELWHYKELLYFMIWRDLKVRYKQTALGALWAVIVPTMTMLVFTIFFGRLAQRPSDGIPYPAFSYSALLPWTYFSQALSNTGNCVVTNTDLVTKVYFPRLILPLSSVISGFVDFLIASTVLVALFIYYDIDLSLRMLLVLPMMIPVICCALGAGALLAIVNVRYRDIKYTIPFLIQMWLFLTPVIYPTSILPDKYRFVVALNPIAGIIEGIRGILFPQKGIDWGMIGLSTAISMLIMVVGVTYFLRSEKKFADII